MQPLPDSLIEAFHDVIADQLPGWRGSPSELYVQMDQKRHSISEICELVNEHYEPKQMPRHFIDLICAEADGTFDPLVDLTFQGGARYVLKIIERRKSHFQSKHV